ncbi:MAG: tripartite tricarboxylate transporter substrate-binding protein [Xanthobacteraceae bacterium]
MSARLSEKLGQPVVVQNKAGASGIIATEYVIHSNPDGYTLLFGSSAQTTSVPMTETVNYRVSDLTPISASGNGPMILAVNANMPVHSLKEFVDYVKANPGKFTYASAGIGSVAHLVGALFVARAGLQALHVPFRGAGPATAALIGGQVDFYFGNSADLLPHEDDEHIRILAVSTPERMPQLPNIPAVSEAIPGFTMSAWQGFLGPAHIPQPIVDRLAKEISSIAKEPDIVAKLAAAGVEATSTTPAQFSDLIQNEQSVYAEAVQAAGIKRQ